MGAVVVLNRLNLQPVTKGTRLSTTPTLTFGPHWSPHFNSAASAAVIITFWFASLLLGFTCCLFCLIYLVYVPSLYMLYWIYLFLQSLIQTLALLDLYHSNVFLFMICPTVSPPIPTFIKVPNSTQHQKSPGVHIFNILWYTFGVL